MPSIMPWRKWAYKPVGPDPDTDPEAAAGSADDDEKLTQESTPLTTPLHRERPAVTAAAAAAAAAGGGGGGSSPFPLGAAAAAAAAAAVLFFLVLFVFTPRPWLPADRAPQVAHYTCGNSTAAATAAGCKFDVMSYTWVHPRCFDQELMYEFLGRAGWRWYLGEGEAGAEAEALALEDVAKGQHEYVYVTWEYYVTHCTYMWRKMHRSLLTSRALDSYVSDYRHTDKCERVLLDRERQMDSTSVMLVAKYPSCPVVSK